MRKGSVRLNNGAKQGPIPIPVFSNHFFELVLEIMKMGMFPALCSCQNFLNLIT